MIRRHAQAFRVTLMATDAATAVGLALGASVIRFGRHDAIANLQASLPDTRVTATVFAVGWIVTLWIHGLYRTRTRWTWRREIKDVLSATVLFFVATLAALYLLKLADVSRLLLVYLFPALALGAIASRALIRALYMVLRETGRNTRFMVVVGANERGQAFADKVEAHHELGLKVLGHVAAAPDDDRVFLRRPLLGTLDQLSEILHSEVVDEVAICLPLADEETIDAVAALCEDEGKIVRIPFAILERTLSAGRVEELDGLPVFSLVTGPDRFLGLAFKRAIDILGATMLLVALFPVFLVLATIIKLESSGPIHFRQTRVGLHGRTFSVVKFRTMCQDAEDRLKDLRHLNEINGHAFKMENDPRITRAGRLLRKTSLDELPQLWNVLSGQMSLVGPRPPLPNEVAGYDIWHRRRLSMKPGMTGLWQIGARRDPEFDRWVEKDLEYIDNWSLWLDIKIMFRTVPAMLTGR